MPPFFKASLIRSAFLLFLTTFAARAQEAAEVPLGAIPTQYNGGFVGEAGSPRVNTVIGVENTPYFRGGYRCYTSYDQFIPAIRSGVGVMAGYAYSSTAGGYLSNLVNMGRGPYLSLAVAPKLSLRGKVTVSPSVDVSLYWGQHTHRDSQGDYAYRINTVRSRVGLLLNTEKFYFGYSVHLVDRFEVQRNDTVLWFPRNRFEKFNSYFQVGYTFGHPTESRFSCTPQLVFRLGTPRYGLNTITPFHAVDFNLGFRYRKVIWGLNLTGVYVGWHTDRFRIVLSDRLEYLPRENPGYIANLAVRYIFKE